MVADPIVYLLDDQDQFVHVNDAWNRFAQENGGTALLRPEILGKSIWNYICDATTITLYRKLFQKARAHGSVCLTLRCDAPHLRRTIALTLRKCQKTLEMRSHTLSESPRPAIAALGPAPQHSNHLVRMCGWCNQIQLESGAWVEIEDAIKQLRIFHEPLLPQMTHGICQSCLEKVEKTLS